MADHDTHDHTGIPGVGAPSEITDIPTAETDTTLRLAPDGAGGVEWAASAGASLTSVNAVLSGDVTMTTANTFYDGPNTGSLAAGTWLINYKMHFLTPTTNSQEMMTKLWDGSTVYDEAQQDNSATTTGAGYVMQVVGFALVTLGSPATLKISGTSIRGSTTMLRDVSNGTNVGSSHTATRICAVKIA